MRPGIIIGITIILFVSLQGCGRKAPLKLPEAVEQTSTLGEPEGTQSPATQAPLQEKGS